MCRAARNESILITADIKSVRPLKDQGLGPTTKPAFAERDRMKATQGSLLFETDSTNSHALIQLLDRITPAMKCSWKTTSGSSRRVFVNRK